MRKEQIQIIRVIPLLVIAVSTIILSCVLSLMREIYWDLAICVAFVDMLFLMVLLFELEYDRKNRLIANNVATTFSRVAGGYVICCVISIAFLVVPPFFMPVMLFPLILCAVGNEYLGVTGGIWFVVLYAMVFEADSCEVIAYVCMVLLAGGLAKTLSDRRYRLHVSLLFFFVNLIVPFVFYYLQYQKVNLMTYVYGLLPGAASGLFAYFGFYVFRRDTEKELEDSLWNLLSDDYSEVKKLKKCFPADYEHAKKVSDIAKRVSGQIGLNTALAAAAGFYYRIGKWSGGNYVEVGVERAQSLNFPIELIRIIAEYNGQEHKPSTPTSAVIHMIDSLTLKLDAIKGEELAKSAWNLEMIIYQTLNEYSSTGLYDMSGLGMNQFLKVREFLVKEKSLQ